MKINIGKFLLDAGKGLLKDLPGGNIAMSVINAILPEDKKISKNTSADQALNTVNSLPAEQKAFILGKELDLEITESNNWAAIMKSFSDVDKAGNSTRPRIALMMAQTVCFTIIAFISIWCIAIILDRKEMVKQLSDSYMLVFAVLATPTALLRAYFGMRTKEKQTRYQVATGQPKTNIVTELMGMFKK